MKGRTEELRKDDSHIVLGFVLCSSLKVRRERITKDTGEDKLDEHMEGCDEERIGKREAVGREHPFVVDRERHGRLVSMNSGVSDEVCHQRGTTNDAIRSKSTYSLTTSN